MTQPELDAQFQGSEIERRLADLEMKVSQYENGGMDLFRTMGVFRMGQTNLELNFNGLDGVAVDSGDSFGSVNTGIRFRWLKDKFRGTPLAEIGGGYSTPGVLTLANMVVRAFMQADAGSTAKLGIWDDTNARWETVASVQDSSGRFLIGVNNSGVLNTVLNLSRVDADNYTLEIRKGGVLVAVGSVATDTIFDAKGDLPVGTGADTAKRLAVGTDRFILEANSGTSTGLSWAGSSFHLNSQSSDCALTIGDFLKATATLTATLPTGMPGNTWIITKNASTGILTVARGGSDTIFTTTSVTSFTLGPGEAAALFYDSNATQWQVF